jgi:CBS domain-containing protein
MKDIKAKDIMTSPVISANKSASSRDIAMQLVSGPFSGVPVTDDEGRIIGVITEHDLLNKVREGKDLLQLTAEDVMQKNPITVDVNTPLRDWTS